MIASSAETARLTPPETGASMSRSPRLASSGASSRVPTGDDELMSMTVAPRFIAPATQSRKESRAPQSTRRTMFPFGSIVITMSEPRPTSSRLAATRQG